jgi:ABC-type transporter Mla subunit MlaD
MTDTQSATTVTEEKLLEMEHELHDRLEDLVSKLTEEQKQALRERIHAKNFTGGAPEAVEPTDQPVPDELSEEEPVAPLTADQLAAVEDLLASLPEPVAAKIRAIQSQFPDEALTAEEIKALLEETLTGSEA